MSGNHIIVESGSVIYVIGPREGHTWHDHKGMWEVCKIDNAVMWDSPEDEAIDRENARKIRDGLNSYASSQAEIERLTEKLTNCVHALTFAIDGWDEGDPFIQKLRATRDGAKAALSGGKP